MSRQAAQAAIGLRQRVLACSGSVRPCELPQLLQSSGHCPQVNTLSPSSATGTGAYRSAPLLKQQENEDKNLRGKLISNAAEPPHTSRAGSSLSVPPLSSFPFSPHVVQLCAPHSRLFGHSPGSQFSRQYAPLRKAGLVKLHLHPGLRHSLHSSPAPHLRIPNRSNAVSEAAIAVANPRTALSPAASNASSTLAAPGGRKVSTDRPAYQGPTPLQRGLQLALAAAAATRSALAKAGGVVSSAAHRVAALLPGEDTPVGRALAAVGRSGRQAGEVIQAQWRAIEGPVRLQTSGFWQRHEGALSVVTFATATAVLWKAYLPLWTVEGASTVGWGASFVSLGLAAGSVAAAAAGWRSLTSINVETVYRRALLQINSEPAVLEVLGAPVQGSTARAFVLAGGDVTSSSLLWPKWVRRRLFLVFKVRGAEMSGLVSVEARKSKRWGGTEIRLLAIDAPAVGRQRRVVIVGEPGDWASARVVLEDMQEPLIRALSLTRQFEKQDEMDQSDTDILAAEGEKTPEKTTV